MAKLKSPLKTVRIELDLSRSELASLAYPSQDDKIERAQLSQSIARCEAGLLDPEEDASLKYLFQRLSEQGYKSLQHAQKKWIAARKVILKRQE